MLRETTEVTTTEPGRKKREILSQPSYSVSYGLNPWSLVGVKRWITAPLIRLTRVLTRSNKQAGKGVAKKPWLLATVKRERTFFSFYKNKEK